MIYLSYFIIISLVLPILIESVHRDSFDFELHFKATDIEKAKYNPDHFPAHFKIDVQFENRERKYIEFIKVIAVPDDCNYGFCIFETKSGKVNRFISKENVS